MRAFAATGVFIAALGCALGGCGDRRTRAYATLPSSGFAVFDAPPARADNVTREVASTLSQSLQPEFSSQDIAAARRVLGARPGWLVPAANGEICLVHLVYPTVATLDGSALPPATAHICAPEAKALTEGMVESQSLTSGTYAQTARIVGVAPNGVRAVTIVWGERRHTRVEVAANAYEAQVRDPVAVDFVVRSHGRSYAHRIPLALVRARNRSPATPPNTGMLLNIE